MRSHPHDPTHPRRRLAVDTAAPAPYPWLIHRAHRAPAGGCLTSTAASPLEFVALDIVSRRQEVTAVAAVLGGSDGDRELQFVVGERTEAATTVASLDEIAE